ncbi:uncharacterized protein LOC144341846, partial [Saccoglossus kowalevskii]
MIDPEETLTASEEEDDGDEYDNEIYISSNIRNIQNCSVEDVVLNFDCHGTDDNGVTQDDDDDDDGDDSSVDAVDMIKAPKCIAYVSTIVNLVKKLHGDVCCRNE